MTQMKRRLSILLCFVMVFTSVFVVAPTKVQAADTTYALYDYFTDGTDVYVYKGAKNFYAGDYYIARKSEDKSVPGHTIIETTTLGYLSQLKGVTYNSSKPSVATITKAGLITPKKTGKTTITIKYKSLKRTFNLNVVSEKNIYKKIGDYYKNTAATMEKSAKAFIKAVGSSTKLTTKNRYKLLNATKDYNHSYGYTTWGESVQNPDGTITYKSSYYVYSTSAGHANVLRSKITTAIDEYNPFSTYNAKYFKVSSIKGTSKSKTITINLKKAVTANDIFGANYAFSWDTEVEASDTYSFPIVVQRESNGKKYYGEATIKKGKKTMTIKLKNHKLVKGATYKLLAKTGTNTGSWIGNWLEDGYNKNTFKITK